MEMKPENVRRWKMDPAECDGSSQTIESSLSDEGDTARLRDITGIDSHDKRNAHNSNDN